MGKVHGSLARAGKVKNQTPKVQKQEKKKPVTGRAKKRQLYNRRFTTTDMGGASDLKRQRSMAAIVMPITCLGRD
ncbi:40S ribosomal protein S30, putative [Eimeria tenella]|uniref:40S ribosomal protein S30 n=1 Tax=Eimeria tenella TaxID=5802 RepID=U6L3E2_EIMTE|nr:40S ribosomal protein S30, putative [Eimeria tenella]CDJ43129.1 40S ribosomal protein S30, putative [Eimeria tenella]|eukprot:XP_013233879.1 40S ribosomal protein S30, putative [Eimeria tenella]